MQTINKHEHTSKGSLGMIKGKISKELKKFSVPKLDDVTHRISKQRPQRIYQPTYRLEPKIRFNPEKVENIMKRIIDPELEELEYNDKLIPELCIILADAIRTAVVEENFDRFRIIVVISIGQKRQQSVRMIHSFLWDADRDMFATHFCENNQVYAHATVYGVYLD